MYQTHFVRGDCNMQYVKQITYQLEIKKEICVAMSSIKILNHVKQERRLSKKNFIVRDNLHKEKERFFML